VRAHWPLLVALLLSAVPLNARPLEFKVVSYNVWGLPFGLADDRDERIAAIGPALAKLKPDLVALQEVWVPENGATLKTALADAGLKHTVFESEGFIGSGLLIASRYPIEVETFQRYRHAGKPHKLWHGDWFARKGVLIVRVSTPKGMLRVANTHLHASYGSEEYRPVQISQALQAADLLGTHGEDPPPHAADPARPPLILCGDLNSTPEDLPFRLLTARAALRAEANTPLRIDWVLARSGGDLRARVVKAKHVLDAEDTRLSDHPCVLATVRLTKGPPKGWRPKRDVAAWGDVAEEALPRVELALEAARQSRGRSRGWSLLLLLGAAALFGLDRRLRKHKKKSCLLPLTTMVLLHLAVWAMYLGVVYEPTQVSELKASALSLGSAPH
jgi:endonuclease/exonuclease/phosphatase family metal-dependent hydrolase